MDIQHFLVHRNLGELFLLFVGVFIFFMAVIRPFMLWLMEEASTGQPQAGLYFVAFVLVFLLVFGGFQANMCCRM